LGHKWLHEKRTRFLSSKFGVNNASKRSSATVAATSLVKQMLGLLSVRSHRGCGSSIRTAGEDQPYPIAVYMPEVLVCDPVLL